MKLVNSHWGKIKIVKKQGAKFHLNDLLALQKRREPKLLLGAKIANYLQTGSGCSVTRYRDLKVTEKVFQKSHFYWLVKSTPLFCISLFIQNGTKNHCHFAISVGNKIDTKNFAASALLFIFSFLWVFVSMQNLRNLCLQLNDILYFFL